MDLQTVTALREPSAWALLQSLPEYDEGSALALTTRLRSAGHDPALVAAVLTQSRLRLRGQVKFGDRVGQMLLTPDGVEQATRWQLAARHAQRFAAAGVDTVWDLGCGLGGDALALAAAGVRVQAVEADPATAAMAAHNLQDTPGATVHPALVEDLDLEPGPGVGAWLDPARRIPGRTDHRGRTVRTFSLDQLSPTWEAVQEVAAALGHVGAKLSPSFPRDAVPQGAEAQWTSFGGEVLECVVWWGGLVDHPGRTAQVHTGPADGGRWLEVRDEGGDAGPAPVLSTIDDIGEWLYEPDRAVLQAGLTGILTQAVEGSETAPGAGYVTSSQQAVVPWARRFRVRSVHPLSIKPLRRWAREADIGRLTIKKRLVPIDPDRLRADLRLSGNREAVVVLTPVAGRPMLLEVEPDD
ncbi:class I SAM-dependent methyltransferase [Ornithinimicrobium ciconiae]|uniref:Class I SAM-dependent methyltransferase n=1 Tax=Ornithinimicrobium ciconiae TaxID=2594265 RepID=A0A516G8T4_9MICO|nr:class I SAM-dependent methyltransferase [Ornithinimicrobium ciconiae]QDO87937.1 class I SAM-dependent methyltransferase [Ornithinimicrobium ciconiae]